MLVQPKYKKQIRGDAKFKQSVVREVFSAEIVSEYIFQKDLILGEIPKKKLPDVYSPDFQIGFELAVADLDEDLDMTKAIVNILMLESSLILD